MPHSTRRRYMPRPDRPVAAVRLDFDADGFSMQYRKWGGEQRARAGDWLVDNRIDDDHDVYTVDAAVFARTYRAVPEQGPGAYVKTTPIWAERADKPGVVPTTEGSTAYKAGDYLVSNAEDGSDRYAIAAGTFEKLYAQSDE